VKAGEHRFLWSYFKDKSKSQRNEAAWLDNIVFPELKVGYKGPVFLSKFLLLQMNPARNGGIFYLIFKMSVGYVKSYFELLNSRCWQDILTLGQPKNSFYCAKINEM
jgi:hypothetical protein